jgi:hypothetical protein
LQTFFCCSSISWYQRFISSEYCLIHALLHFLKILDVVQNCQLIAQNILWIGLFFKNFLLNIFILR